MFSFHFFFISNLSFNFILVTTDYQVLSQKFLLGNKLKSEYELFSLFSRGGDRNLPWLGVN